MKTSDALQWVVLTIAGYVAYRLLDKAREKIESGVDWIAAPIATAIIKFTLPEPVGVTGAAILPNGSPVSFNALSVNKTVGKEEYWFAYQGHTYQLGPRSTKGNYPTRLLK